MELRETAWQIVYLLVRRGSQNTPNNGLRYPFTNVGAFLIAREVADATGSDAV
jgi:hypothetical protein